MGIGIVALVLATAAAAWLLMRAARSHEPMNGGGRSVAILKGVVWLGLAAAMFAARLWPLAFMILIAAGGVTAIELWRDRAIQADKLNGGQNAGRNLSSRTPMTVVEAAAVLGIDSQTKAVDIRAAHKKLIGQLHPDRGGTDYLAAKINDARDILLSANAPEK